ncbi:RraA-like protein [Globomyces pollinis-pini]|nr:RraA-like protein [Globomyces pollinis-pini]
MDPVQQLEPYGSCDISDALCKLIDMNIIGHIPNVKLYSPSCSKIRVSGPAYTVKYVLSSDTTSPKAKVNHVDTAPAGSIIVIQAPPSAPNALFGGLLSTRAMKVGVKGVVVEGKIRDVTEMREMGFPVWAVSQSTMGAAPFCRSSTVGEPITLGAETGWPVTIETGDIIVADEDGVVRVPIAHVELIASECARRTEIDRKCLVDLQNGATLVETFAKHR